MSRRRHGRGQTLLLFALTMLLVVLMVCMTLSIAVKTKEKMEVQNLADAAAYSNAVVTARVFNEISLMNRAQTAQMVSMAAVQSLISWSGFYRAQLEATRRNYERISENPYGRIVTAACPCAPSNSGCRRLCRCARDAQSKISEEIGSLEQEGSRIASGWNQLDQAAGTQARRIQGAASALNILQLIEWGRLDGKLSGQSLAEDIIRQSNGSVLAGELQAPGGADEVSRREVGFFNGALLPVRAFNDHHIAAAMGTRGWTFVTNRSGADGVIRGKISGLVSDPVQVSGVGNAFWASSNTHGKYPVSGKYNYAEDHGNNTVTFSRANAPCPNGVSSSWNVTARVFSTDLQDETDSHQWSPMTPGADDEPPSERHTMGRCVVCPGVWPFFMDYNPIKVVDGDDLHGQPKNYAVVQRNYRARAAGNADPWNLMFRFRFTADGEEGYDGRGIQLSPQFGSMDISRQTALSTGLTYYHRMNHWKEPPNTLNPFWRATLVPLDIDQQGESDPVETLHGAGAAWAADAYQALRNRGFRGWQ